jgi:hypothetical protein
MPAPGPDDRILTPRLRLGFGLMAFGVGLMFLGGKVLAPPVPGAIAAGITLGVIGLVVVIVEGLREPPEDPPQSR